MIPDSFHSVNITDTCALWHLVGADTLFRNARRANIFFVITPTVYYECFIKPGSRQLTADRRQQREALREHLEADRVTRVGLSIEDLQETIEFAKRRDLRKRIGQGELSCAALARKMGYPAVLTDNKRDLTAIGALVNGRVQTTPRLLGWLYVEGHITDSDVGVAVREHEAGNGQMAEVYRKAHQLACEKLLMRRMAPPARQEDAAAPSEGDRTR